MKTVKPKTTPNAVAKKRIKIDTSARKTVATKRTAVRKTAVKKDSAPPAATKRISKTATTAPLKIAKAKKVKLVRDSFTIPKNEYVVIDSLKKRAIAAGQAVKKSELLRAGIKALAAMSDGQFKGALSHVPSIKTGRPKKST